MSVVGIIAEFNPLHSGHKLVLDEIKRRGDTAVCVISGNFVQRGEPALISKHKRANMALLCGADIVAEMPIPWSMSTAQNFALGGVSQCYHLGCDKIIFGSETGDIDLLKGAVDILCSDEFSCAVAEELKLGVTFAAAREKVARSLGVPEGLLSNPNDNLGIEYILAARRLGLSGLVEFECIKRVGAAHDSKIENAQHISASLIRDYIRDGKIGYAERFLPMPARGILSEELISQPQRLETAVLAALRTKTAEDFALLPDISEGLENKLLFAAKKATTLEGLFASVKSKRYTLARVRRLVFSAFLGLDNRFFMTPPPYVRILGVSEGGIAHLKQHKSLIPIVTRVADFKGLDDDCRAVFEIECRATDLFALSLCPVHECGDEYKYKFIVAK